MMKFAIQGNGTGFSLPVDTVLARFNRQNPMVSTAQMSHGTVEMHP
jgi:hypothetical protein